MRTITISKGEYYHIYNRGYGKQLIFLNQKDLSRFLFLILYFQSPVNFPQVNRLTNLYDKNNNFEVEKEDTEEILSNRYIDLISYCFMPNHFHLILKEVKENGISQYMQRIQNSHTKYFNLKYERTGHLFQGPFKIVHIEDNEQLLHLSAYIHRNPREISQWRNKEDFYEWSSYQDYIHKNRWGEILKTDIILDQFDNTKEYRNFTDSSSTKEA